MKVLFLVFLLILLVCIYEANGGRGRGGSRGGSRGGGSQGGGSRKKPKIGKIKGGTLKKAAVIGVGAYGAYKIGKLTGKYSSWKWGKSKGIDFDDWNDWREVDGFLCRSTLDCSWVDPKLYCQDYELSFTPSVSL